MTKCLIVLVVFLFAISLRLWNLNQVGRSWDETFLMSDGYKVLELTKKGDFSNQFWYTSTVDHPMLAKYLYGLVAILDIKKNSPNDNPVFNYDLTFGRLMSVLLSSLTVLLIVLFGWKYISPFVGVTAGLILAMLPFFLGLSQLVTIESPLIFFFTASVYAFLNFFQKISFKKAILTGIILGLALEVKFTNTLLFPLLILIYLIWFYNVGRKKHFKFINKKILLVFITALIVFFVIWPMPWLHLKEFWAFTYDYRFSEKQQGIPEVFFGRLMMTPVVYYFIYFLITTPVLLLILFFIGLKNIDLKKKWILYVIVLWFVFPFTQSLYSVRQKGISYIIEIYAPFSLIAAMGFDYLVSKLTKKTLMKFILFLPIVGYLFIVLFRITPYYLDYFNIVVGGTKNVFEKKMFHLGWWGQGEKEAALYLKNNAPKGSNIGIHLNPSHNWMQIDGLKSSEFDPQKKYDYVVVNYYVVIRQGFDENIVRKDYKLIYSVMADGAELVHVYKKN